MREKQIAVLFILFNHTHRDIADELGISEGESRQIARKLYIKLEEQDLLKKYDNIKAVMNDQNMIQKMQKYKVTNPLLAFYILTEPEIEPIY